MAKQVVANMNIKHDGQTIAVGDVIDPKKFDKDQLTRLYERGAVKIVNTEDEKKKQEKLTLDDVESAKAEGEAPAEAKPVTLTPAPTDTKSSGTATTSTPVKTDSKK